MKDGENRILFIKYVNVTDGKTEMVNTYST